MVKLQDFDSCICGFESYRRSIRILVMKVKTAEYGHWKSHCGIIFRTRTELYSHNKECLECIEWNSNKYKRSGETRKNEWNEEKSKKF